MWLLNDRDFTGKPDPMSPMPHGRNVPRITVTGQASLISVLTKDSAVGTLVDISRTGVRLNTNQRFQRDQKLALTLKLPWDKSPIEVLLAAVKWVRGNNIGVEFIDIEADDQTSLNAFLSSWSKP
jgi:NOL1/NOP2/fmu family ribosome biogenesis protein